MVKMPTLSDVKYYQEVISAKYHQCTDMWPTADMFKLKIQGTGGDLK